MAKLKPFTMPKWGIEMSEGTIAEWMVAENQPFAKGTVLTLIETDKITNEVEAEADGRFVRLIAEAGQTYPVGALLAVLSDGGEADPAEIDALVAGFKPVDASFATDGGETAPAASPSPVEVPAPVPTAPAIPDGIAISPAARDKAVAAGLDVISIDGSGRAGRITAQDVDRAISPPAPAALVGVLPATPASSVFATPMARRVAVLHGVALEKLTGSGPRGRVRKADVLAAIPAPAPPAEAPVSTAPGEVEVLPMSSMRRTIARRLTESKQQIPHFYVRRRVRADRLLALRAAVQGPRPSINDYLIRACALALVEVPEVNIQVHGQDIHRFGNADIAVAVATGKGLVTPIVRAADELSVARISEAMTGLAQRARSGKLKTEEFSGGSFSLSNLGGFGVEQFDAIINPPQGAILAVGSARPEPIDDDGAIRIVPVLHLSLSCDHRAIDGADAGRFMAALAALIETPALL
ncbi:MULTISPECIES: 2-oxo acid dehydrogenase subunit E2 [unclassified Sphingomonas]|uniref:2-oxo acid dehydrogenase subunit E2 n=1 Tax=unclassified Sphingomonas TaxID=196159 RepID=UPI0006FAF87E|nr:MULTISPECIES: 2-oxo acid dehydrogenase subunit E2 [unclassified Sphingomonas]KQX23335.1 dehydrogenase [Sphingomonas sp. Root1294]KQY68184.1 dehydrogenase [Sphingomonas sp. Root50]KRB91079.1 dehydrogenase [Sphingomonas sp. Root720]